MDFDMINLMLHVGIQRVYQPLPHVDGAGVDPGRVPVLVAELPPGHRPEMIPSVPMTTHKRTPAVSVSQGHASLRIICACQTES